MIAYHTAVFFTSNRCFAEGAGKNIAVVTLLSTAKILDTTGNYADCESLRKAVKANPLASATLNVDHDYWHKGWITGNVLRVAHNNPIVGINIRKMINE